MAENLICAIQIIFEQPPIEAEDMPAICDILFEHIDFNCDGNITYEEMKDWIEVNLDLMELLETYEPNREVPFKKSVFEGMHRVSKKPSGFLKVPSIVVRGTWITQPHIIEIKRIFDEFDTKSTGKLDFESF